MWVIRSGLIQGPASTWKGHEMDYLTERVQRLKKEFEGMKWDDEQSAFIEKLIGILQDCAIISDDLVDAVDELDMRISEAEHNKD